MPKVNIMKFFSPKDLLDQKRSTSNSVTDATAVLRRTLGSLSAHAPYWVPYSKAPNPQAPHPQAPHPQAPNPQAPNPQARHPHAPNPQAPHPQAPHLFAPHPIAPHPGAGFPNRTRPASPPRNPNAPGAGFKTASFTGPAGTRPYKTYIPANYAGQPVPLVVMLHGCSQSPDDFAAGTRMNQAAEAHDFIVAYPAQTGTANAQKCWNWFNPADQQRNGGEASLIAGITRQVMHDFAIDPARVYVAGLSAGAAAAAIMANTYPELYAAVGIHSGLACGAARDMQSAFTAMQRGNAGARSATGRIVPAIVFHGDRDTTVNARNADAVIAQAVQGQPLRTRVEAGRVPNGHTYTRASRIDSDGNTQAEQWAVHGAGHAWSGGSPDGSYTDPRGPDATSEMLRFFRQHPHPSYDAR